MKYRREDLLNLLQASQDYKNYPEDEEKWRAFQEALRSVEDYERQIVVTQLEEQKHFSLEMRENPSRYYRKELRSRSRFLLRGLLESSIARLIGLAILITLLWLLLNANPPDHLLTFNPDSSLASVTQSPPPTGTLPEIPNEIIVVSVEPDYSQSPEPFETSLPELATITETPSLTTKQHDVLSRCNLWTVRCTQD